MRLNFYRKQKRLKLDDNLEADLQQNIVRMDRRWVGRNKYISSTPRQYSSQANNRKNIPVIPSGSEGKYLVRFLQYYSNSHMHYD